MSLFKLSILCLCFISTLFFQSGCDKHAQDREVIDHIFDKVMAAQNNKDGDAYVELISQEAIDYYANLQKLVMNGKKADIQALPMYQRFEVLLIRIIGKKAEIKNLDGKGFAEWWVKTGVRDYMPEPDGRLELDGLEFRVNEAIGDLSVRIESQRRSRYGRTRTVVRHVETPYRVRFVLVNGIWKYDLSEYNNMIGYALEDLIDSERDPNRALVDLLGEVTKQEPPPAIWDKVLH